MYEFGDSDPIRKLVLDDDGNYGNPTNSTPRHRQQEKYVNDGRGPDTIKALRQSLSLRKKSTSSRSRESPEQLDTERALVSFTNTESSCWLDTSLLLLRVALERFHEDIDELLPELDEWPLRTLYTLLTDSIRLTEDRVQPSYMRMMMNAHRDLFREQLRSYNILLNGTREQSLFVCVFVFLMSMELLHV